MMTTKAAGFWPKSRGDDDDDDDVLRRHCEGRMTTTAQRANGNAAKAGTVAPPKNGLFTDGTAPSCEVGQPPEHRVQTMKS